MMPQEITIGITMYMGANESIRMLEPASSSYPTLQKEQNKTKQTKNDSCSIETKGHVCFPN